MLETRPTNGFHVFRVASPGRLVVFVVNLVKEEVFLLLIVLGVYQLRCVVERSKLPQRVQGRAPADKRSLL